MARAFEVILHKGAAGTIYNIGGTHEKANIDVARDLIRLMGKGDKEVGCGVHSERWVKRESRSRPNISNTAQTGEVPYLREGPRLQRHALHHRLGRAQAAGVEGGGERVAVNFVCCQNSIQTYTCVHALHPQVAWEEGLRQTVEWYKQYAGRYGDNIESALVPHPSRRASASCIAENEQQAF